MLTGKAKEDFLNYYWENYIGKTRCITKKEETEDFFKSLIAPLKTTLLIEWFDFVNINIHTDITSYYYVGRIYVTSLDSPDYSEKYYHNVNRNHVMNQLILKANEIYNRTE